jgi:type III secretion protein D
VLSITQGLHKGVRLPLDKPTYLIGSASSTDLLLSDIGIAERHMTLQFARGHVTVEAVGGDVTVIGRHGPLRIPMGSGHRARLPLSLHAGAAQLTLSDSDEAPAAPGPRPATPSRPKAVWVIALGVVCACAGALVFRDASAVPAGQSSGRNVQAPVLATQPLTADAAQARHWLEQQLATAGLSHLNVSELDGQLAVRGSYDPQKKSQWLNVQQAYDRRFGQRVMLRQNAMPRAEVTTPKIRLQAVWFGKDPYVVNDAGKRLYPGATVVDDWTLEAIEHNHVILARGEERFTFTL